MKKYRNKTIPNAIVIAEKTGDIWTIKIEGKDISINLPDELFNEFYELIEKDEPVN